MVLKRPLCCCIHEQIEIKGRTTILGYGLLVPAYTGQWTTVPLGPVSHTVTFLSANSSMGIWVVRAFASADKTHIPSVYFNVYILKNHSITWWGCHTEQTMWGEKRKRVIGGTPSLELKLCIEDGLINWESNQSRVDTPEVSSIDQLRHQSGTQFRETNTMEVR